MRNDLSLERLHRVVHPKKYRELLNILLLLILSSLVMVLSFQSVFIRQETRSKASDTGPMVALLPSIRSVAPGDTASYAVSVASRSDSIAAITIDIRYDDQILTSVEYTPGEQFPVVLNGPNNLNGRFSVTVGVLPGHPYSGTGIIGTLKVRGAKTARTTLSFGENTSVASIGKSSNSVASKTAATLVVKELPLAQTSIRPDSGIPGSVPVSVQLESPSDAAHSKEGIHETAEITSLQPEIRLANAVNDPNTEYSPYAESMQNTIPAGGIFSSVILFFQRLWSALVSLL